MIGDGTFHHVEYGINTFSKRGPSLNATFHYVHPHMVSSYRRKDGTLVKGFWRDGDGNTKVNRAFGYFAANPGSLWGR